ncbi:hypothetical protein UY3_10630 [Chelonia mydas]|uniref:Uncharacterized protein n=1 Tax=Chelonia mydas TaxID=8469 RepID=M7B2U9_CHEMY|nr:hypothetical protein UY3_10630 [Chelonia mydas]
MALLSAPVLHRIEKRRGSRAESVSCRHCVVSTPWNEQEDKQHSIGSSVLNSVRTRRGRITDNSILSSSRVLLASSRKMPTHRRLPSLTSDPLCSKTPNVYSDEVLRGTKLYTGLDRLSSPLVHTARNKLPPINTETVEQYLSVPGSRQGFHRGRYPHSRVSSAVPDSTEQRPLRERTVIIDQFSRPNTTNTFRSDTPHKRSLTPMDFANHTWTGQGFLTDPSLDSENKANHRSQPRFLPLLLCSLMEPV